MTLDSSEKQLALLYLATVQGIAYGTRHIVEHCNAHGHKVREHIFTQCSICHNLEQLEVFYEMNCQIIYTKFLYSICFWLAFQNSFCSIN